MTVFDLPCLAPAAWSLTYEEVHVWHVALEQPPECLRTLERLLAAEERRRADRFVFEKDRHHFIVGRGVLRLLLGGYRDTDPARVPFTYGFNGKPALADGSTLRFNLSHSGGLAAYAFTHGRELGIDVEQLRPLPDAEGIAERFFSRTEREALRALPGELKCHGFFNCWTRKEAYLKACGSGLARPLDEFDVTLRPGEPARLLHVVGQPDEVTRWSLCELTPPPGYVAALMVEGHGWRLQTRCVSCRGEPADV
jgi:4'-phosphopantetheinyl transferase